MVQCLIQYTICFKGIHPGWILTNWVPTSYRVRPSSTYFGVKKKQWNLWIFGHLYELPMFFSARGPPCCCWVICVWGDRASGRDSNPSQRPSIFLLERNVVFFREMSGSLRKFPPIFWPRNHRVCKPFSIFFWVIKWDKFEQHHPKKRFKMMEGFIHLSFWWGETWT